MSKTLPQDLNLPSGIVTFLFTDIEGSSTLWERDPEGMKASLARHDAILHASVVSNGGQVFKLIGDAFQAAFTKPAQAVQAALEAQRGLAAEDWGRTGPIRVRMGLHAGPVQAEDDDFAPNHTMNRVARVMSAGHGGQVLLSAAVAELVRGQLPEGVDLRDLGLHRVKGLEQPEHLFQLVTPDLPAEFSPLNTLSGSTGNLPTRLTSLIGREAEVTEVRSRLAQPRIRLVTLTGPGGVGKTSLGLEIAAGLASDFKHGIYWVPLAAVDDPDLVTSAIARALDVRERGGYSLLESLKDYLQDKHLLLLLDNFEQVIAASPSLAELLAEAPGLKILATSRAPLRLRGENEIPVQPLELPESHLPDSPDRLQHNAAVQLFTERAQAANPAFTLSEENAVYIREIVRRLDGLPLAIELAAARSKLLPPRSLLSRLESRLNLLTGGARDLPPRQQTMRSTIDWSYSLLDPPAQALFSRLSVFSGGFTFEAAEAICNSEGELDVFEELASLLDNSLLHQEPDIGGQARFSVLETIREYARERLVEAGEEDLLRHQHARFFARLAGEAEHKFFSGESESWLDRLEPDHNNFRAALSCLQAEPQHLEMGWQVIFNLLWLWYRRGYLNEARRWYEKAIPQAANLENDPRRAKVLEGAGLVEMWQSDLEAAARFMDEGLTVIRKSGDAADIALSLFNRGVLAINQGDNEKALDLLNEAFPLFQQLGQEWFQAMILLHQGNVALSQRDITQSQDRMKAALALGRQVGDGWIVASAINNLGEIARYQGDYDRAEKHYLESKEIFQDVISSPDVARANHSLGFIALARGDYVRAGALFREGLDLHQKLGVKRGVVECLAGLAAVKGAQGQAAQAVRLLSAARSQMAALGAGIWPADHTDHERYLAGFRAQLSEEQFSALVGEGRTLRLEEAIAQTLNEEVPYV